MATATQPAQYAGREWSFDEENHVCSWVDGGVIPTVTQILTLAGLSDYSAVPERVLRVAKERGTAVHEWTQLLDEYPALFEEQYGALADQTSELNTQILAAVGAYAKFIAETNFRPLLIEHRVVGIVNGLAYSCCLDRTGTIDSDQFMSGEYVLELKCTSKPADTWPVQTIAQKLCLNDGKQRHRAALHLKRDGKFKLIPYINDEADKVKFVAALERAYEILQERGEL